LIDIAYSFWCRIVLGEPTGIGKSLLGKKLLLIASAVKTIYYGSFLFIFYLFNPIKLIPFLSLSSYSSALIYMFATSNRQAITSEMLS